MRRITVVLMLGLQALAASVAQADVTPNRSPDQVGVALTAPAGLVLNTWTLPAVPPNGDPVAVVDSALSDFPRDGSTFAILSSGDAKKADPASTSTDDDDDGGRPVAGSTRPSVYDLTTLRVDGAIPASVNCLVLSFRFFTNEDPGDTYNDGFIAELDASDWTASALGGVINAPHNFAFDAGGNVISVNSSGSTGLSADEAVGTGYAFGTSRLTATTPVTQGAHSVFFSIFDQDDEVVDSAVFLDGLDLENRPAGDCVAGAKDEIAPAVTLAAPANGSTTTDATPAFTGEAGDAPGDATGVSVEIRSGGTLVQTLTTTRAGTAWSVDAAALPNGSYSARAVQLDQAGNTGASETHTFTVAVPQVTVTPPADVPDEPDPPDEPDTSPTPALGKTVVAGVVSGTVRIKLKNGRFRTLGADEEVPLGSTVDATKGKVRLTSAAGPGGKTQTADFYQGAFIVTQTRGSKPITQLALTGKLSCGKRASTSARKKRVRRLWGDGKGRFRTKGRHGAATVKGTKWLTEDRCNGTLFRVKRGVVSVKDFRKKKTVRVKQGKSYLARANG